MMPRYVPGHRAQTRQRILEAARAAALGSGLDGVRVAAVMRGAGGLTPGGFYAHFGSREALIVEALQDASRRKHGALLQAARTRPDPLAAFVRGYLSRAHRDHPERGCPLPSLAAEVGRGAPALRAVIGDGVQTLTGSILILEPGLDMARAQALVAGLVGTLMLARALPDRKASDTLLLQARQTLLEAARCRTTAPPGRPATVEGGPGPGGR